jgi:hypothetical protein
MFGKAQSAGRGEQGVNGKSPPFLMADWHNVKRVPIFDYQHIYTLYLTFK